MDIVQSDTITDIERGEWERLVGTEHAGKSFGWYRAVEDSGMRDMHYIFLKEEGHLVAAATCYPYEEEFLNVKMRFLEVRSPFGTASGLFSVSPEHIPRILKELEKTRQGVDAKGILVLELRARESTFLRPWMKGYNPIRIPDDTYIDLNFADFDDYLASLDASARRSVRKTLNRAEKRWNLTTIFTSEFSVWKETAHRLRGYLCNEHGTPRSHLTESFYEALEKYLKDKAELIVCLKDDVPVASGLILNSRVLAVHKLAGIDPKYKEFQAYFIMYYEGIRKALQRNQRKICFGPTTYEFKEKIGCKREQILGYARLGNPLFQVALNFYGRGLRFLGKTF
ncbi:MAG: GNAT family N-acetyltransferase [Theionarchaea archaeon]|nr:GNAT family N-acetyltransferase [Theionarchaea archaeon]MBU7037618.1 GNAT family N-acetyltransferase [Theionarchaea archaeon]